MKTSWHLLLGLVLAVGLGAPLRVDASRRWLVDGQGKGFFWLGDTAWEAFHRLKREEAVEYLEVRARQGFNVVQMVALAEFDWITSTLWCRRRTSGACMWDFCRVGELGGDYREGGSGGVDAGEAGGG